MTRFRIHTFFLSIVLFLSTLVTVNAQHEEHNDHAATEGKKKFNVGDMIMHHIKDDHGWEFAHGVTLPLPVILYTQEKGLDVFSSSHFAHEANYDGYVKEHNKI